MTQMHAPVRTRQTLKHDALFYSSAYRYCDGIAEFLQHDDYDGPALVAVPAANLELLQDYLGDETPNVSFADMTELGHNPSRIIPTVRHFVDTHLSQPVRFVGEPIWAGRTPAEIAEATRHEALLNLAFADTGAHILCPYDTRRLDPQVLADAECTHPDLITTDGHRASPRYTDPISFSSSERWPLEPAPPHAETLAFDDLTRPRAFVRRQAQMLGLDADRSAALILGVSEVCANSLRHAGGHGTLRIWQTDTSLICEVHDTGTITDPLADRQRPHPDRPGGRGLYVTHQMCDLAEIRSTGGGTTVRLHMHR